MPENPIPTPAIVDREHFIDACELRCRAMNDAFELILQEDAELKRDTPLIGYIELGRIETAAALASGLVRFDFDADQVDIDCNASGAWIVSVADRQHYCGSDDEAQLCAIDALRMAAGAVARMG